MDLSSRLLDMLKEHYSDLGFSPEVMKSVAEVCSVGLSDESSDEELSAQVTKYSPMLRAFQRYSDRRVTDVQRSLEERNKGKGNGEGEEPSWFASYRASVEAEQSALREKISALESAKKDESFNQLVSSIASELGLSDVLELVSSNLSSDMDESAIRSALGRSKQLLSEHGAKFDERGKRVSTSEESAREAAREWAKKRSESING